MRFISSPKPPDGTRAHPASYLWVLGLFSYRIATGAWDWSLILIHGRCCERVGQYYIAPVCLRVTHRVINLFTSLFVEDHNLFYLYADVGPPLWSSGQSFWLQIQRSRVRSPALPDFLSSSGSGTGSTQPREVKLRSYLNKKVAAPGSENRD